METVKWGIVGCGDVTEIKSGPAFSKIKNSELVAVMRRNAAKAEDYAKRHNVPRWYSNANDLINDEEVNAIYVATPPNTHIDYALKAIEAGKPVYVEKPLGLNYYECLPLIDAAKQKQVPAFAAYYRRALPGFLKVKEIIEQNTIGEVRIVNIRLFKSPSEDELEGNAGWRVNPEISGGGHFADLASHQFDYLHFLFGEIDEISSIVENQAKLYKAEDLVVANFKFKNGVVGSGIWCFNSSAGNDVDVIEIIGSKGSVSISCFDFTPVLLKFGQSMQSITFEKPLHVQQNLIEQVVAQLLGGAACVSTVETASKANLVMDKVLGKYYNK